MRDLETGIISFVLFLVFCAAAILVTSDKTGLWWSTGWTLLCPQSGGMVGFLKKCLRSLERAAAGFELKSVVTSGAG